MRLITFRRAFGPAKASGPASFPKRSVFGWFAMLAGVLALAPAALPQAPPPYAAAPVPPAIAATVQDLRIIPLTVNNATNDLQRRIMAPLVVQVLDQESRPLEGVDVTFRFPLNGPSATFADGQSSRTTRTNAEGQAAATGWTANRMVGTFQVQVTATRGNQMGQTMIAMTNATRILDEAKEKNRHWYSSKGAKIGIVAGVAAVVAVSVLAATHGGSSSAGPSVITVTASPGSPTIGAPH